MNKILGVSIAALLAVSPMLAEASPVTHAAGVTYTLPTRASDQAAAVTASASPKYDLASVDTDDQQHIASTAYVKGAYNSAITAINKVSETAGSAVQTVAEGTTNGTIAVDNVDVAVHGLGSAAYTDSTAYASSAQGTAADNAYAAAVTNKTTTVASDNTNLITSAGVYTNAENAAYSDAASYTTGTIGAKIKSLSTTATDAVRSVQVNGAPLTETDGAVNVTVAEGSTDGAIAVNGTAVAVHNGATQAGVINTIRTTTITVPVYKAWGSDDPTVEGTTNTISATVATPTYTTTPAS